VRRFDSIHWYFQRSRETNLQTILWVLLLPSALCGDELAPWRENRHSTDVPRRHVQAIGEGQLKYRIVQGFSASDESFTVAAGLYDIDRKVSTKAAPGEFSG
jgi:hypothetical protein